MPIKKYSLILPALIIVHSIYCMQPNQRDSAAYLQCGQMRITPEMHTELIRSYRAGLNQSEHLRYIGAKLIFSQTVSMLESMDQGKSLFAQESLQRAVNDILATVSNSPTYQEAFQTAQASDKNSEAWKKFRVTAATLAMEYLKQKNIRYPGQPSAEKKVEFLEKNEHLNPNSEDGDYLVAGGLLLMHNRQIQRDATGTCDPLPCQ